VPELVPNDVLDLRVAALISAGYGDQVEGASGSLVRCGERPREGHDVLLREQKDNVGVEIREFGERLRLGVSRARSARLL